MNKRINNIYISGNYYLQEQDILELMNYDNYLKYYEINPSALEKRLKTSLLIEYVSIKKSLFSLKISLTEYKILWYQEYDNNIMLSSGKSIYCEDDILGIPTLINEIADDYKQSFVQKLSQVKCDVLRKISEIVYSPTEVDAERFLLHMNDQNDVYINLSRMENLNKYNDLLPELENHKGILYLDSGNHFEIKD